MSNNNFFQKTISVNLGPSGSTTITDDLHPQAFKNLTIWVRPLAAINYSYSIKYGNLVQASGSKTAGALLTYNDPQIFPPNQLANNWAKQDASGVGYVVGLPVTVTLTNTDGAVISAFLVSIASETFRL